MIFAMTPSRCAETSISFSTMIGPEARKSGDELLAALVSTRTGGDAGSEAATVTGGDAGEVVQAIAARSQSAIAIILTALILNFVITDLLHLPSEPTPKLRPDPHSRLAKQHESSRTPF